MEIKAQCAACGSEEFAYPDKLELDDHDPAICQRCGLSTTAGALRKRLYELAKQAATNAFGSNFKPSE